MQERSSIAPASLEITVCRRRLIDTVYLYKHSIVECVWIPWDAGRMQTLKPSSTTFITILRGRCYYYAYFTDEKLRFRKVTSQILPLGKRVSWGKIVRMTPKRTRQPG